MTEECTAEVTELPAKLTSEESFCLERFQQYSTAHRHRCSNEHGVMNFYDVQVTTHTCEACGASFYFLTDAVECLMKLLHLASEDSSAFYEDRYARADADADADDRHTNPRTYTAAPL